MAVFADFLRVSGIPGEARDNRHQGEIEVLSWSWGLTETPAPGPGPGGAVRPAFDEVSVEKNVDKASALLAQACAAGTHLQEATVSTQQRLGPGVAVDMFVLRLWDVTIRKFHKAATPLSVSPTEAISIA